MRVLYLDFDGVIFTEKTYAATSGQFSEIDLQFAKALADIEACERVSRLAKEKEAVIVISSVWGMYGLDFCTALLEHIIPDVKVIGLTPKKLSATRHMEIGLDLYHRKLSPSDVIILDDDIDMRYADKPLQARWIQTTWEKGFTEECLQKASQLWEEQ